MARAFKVLHERRLDVLADIHEGHSRPTLVFVTFRHEIARIIERFPFARELHADLIDDWNAGKIEMLVAHPASAGHGVNLQYGSDTLVWFSLPWSAELFTQANARLVRSSRRTCRPHGPSRSIYFPIRYSKQPGRECRRR